MKIVIPVEEKSLESAVCPSFGRAPYLLFYNTDTEYAGFTDNSAAASQGGAGVKTAQLVADCGAGALLTPRCGENAAALLAQAQVRVYRTVPGSALSNITEFEAGRLTPLGEFHPGLHGHG